MKWVTRERPKIDAFIDKYQLDDPALARLARVVREERHTWNPQRVASALEAKEPR